MTDQATLPSKPWARLWQVPALLVGITAFVLAIRYLAVHRPQVPFETHISDIQKLITAKNYSGALQQIASVDPYFQESKQQATLAKLSGDAFFFSQQEQAGVSEENCRKGIADYQRAAAGGMGQNPEVMERWGLLAFAMGDYPVTIEKLESVVAENPARLPEFAHKLVKAYVVDEEHPPEKAKVAEALDVLTRLLQTPGLSLDERVWALTKRIQLSLRRGGQDEYLADAKAATPEIPERNPAGILLSWIGRAEFQQGHLAEAKKYLTDARLRFVEHNEDDGRAALLLGKIAQSVNELDAALPLYEEVILSHTGTPIVASSRFGRAEILAANDTPNDQMKSDYEFAIRAMQEEARGRDKPELLDLESIRASLLANHQKYEEAGRYADALVFLALLDDLKEPETPDVAYRHAITEEKLAQEAEGQAAALTDATKRAALRQSALEHYAAAADAYYRHSKLVTLDDEKSSGSLWRAAQLFDKAGATQRAIDTYTIFVRRTTDSRVPEGLYAIGLLYQSLGQYDKAIGYHERNMAEHPKTPAAYLSTVQAARCYMAKGEEFFPQAEKALLSLVQDQVVFHPDAAEFRISLFTLGELYYHTRRWSDAILRLEEALTRYPDDPAAPRATFWLADCYRRSALDIADAIRKDPQIDHRDELEQARLDRLKRAGVLFSRVIELLDPDPNAQAQTPHDLGTLEDDYLRYSYLYRADALFDQGEFVAAIKLYDQTSTRFSQNVIAVEAYVQIVNAYVQLKEPAQAAAAAERARWVLKRMPDDAFGKGPLALSRQYYEDFLKTGQAVQGP